MSTIAMPPSPELPLAPPELVPDLSTFQVEDGLPVDSIYQGFQQQLLVDVLTSGWSGPKDGAPFLAVHDCGLFYAANKPPVAPDVMLSLNVDLEKLTDPFARRSYFQWVIGKPPEVVVEVVSHSPGFEDTKKLELYAQIGVSYYVIFDPIHYLGEEELRLFARQPLGLTKSKHLRMEEVEMGVAVWEGVYAGHHARWLRWTDSNGKLIPTGAERAAGEQQRADEQQRRAEANQQRAETLQSRAEAAEKRAKELEDRLAHFSKKLRDAGMSLNGD